MPDERRHSPARLVAPLALIAFVVALLIVLGGSGAGEGGDDRGSDSGAGSGQPTEPTATDATTEPDKPKRRRRKAIYTVEPGDTLGAIAEETALDYRAPDGRYWKTLDRFDPAALRRIDTLWLATARAYATAA